jgi:hypothetical protein
MKKQIFTGVLLLAMFALTFSACKKDDPEPVIPTVTTADVTDIAYMTAKCGGNVTDDGNADITARGVVFGGASGPTLANATPTLDGTGTGSFVSAISGLAPGQIYFVRAYATNSAGTGYGAEKTFTTLVK